jgi:hypothetical protein
VPASYQIHPARALVLSLGWGILSDADIREHYRQLRDDPAFDPAFRQLADIRDVSRVEASIPTIRDEARTWTFAPEARRALVARSDAPYGLARLFAAYWALEGGAVEVFRDLDDAARWLGVSTADTVALDTLRRMKR